VTSPQSAYKVAALSPVMPDISVVRQANTRLIGFENSAFPYSGTNPRTGSAGSRYGDNRVLVHVPSGFDLRKPGVIVVFFHGHGATLQRDVRDRQLLPRRFPNPGSMPCWSRRSSPTMPPIPAPESSGSATDSSGS
jgi:hypothetical protein